MSESATPWATWSRPKLPCAMARSRSARRALTRFLTPETDKEVVHRYACRSVWSLTREAARHEPPPEPSDVRTQHERRSLHCRHDRRGGMFKMTFTAPADAGATVEAKLAAIADSHAKDPGQAPGPAAAAARTARAPHTLGRNGRRDHSRQPRPAGGTTTPSTKAATASTTPMARSSSEDPTAPPSPTCPPRSTPPSNAE